MKNSYNMYNNLFNRIRKNFHIHNNYTQQSYLPRIIIPWKKKAEQVLLTTVKLPISWLYEIQSERKNKRERDCVSASHRFHPLARIVEEVSRSASNCQAIRDKSE